MKKKTTNLLLAAFLLMLMVAVPATTASAAKPSPNLAAAQDVGWNLSGAVMPTPPNGAYGLDDIPGSDTASKLIANQPNGNTEVTLTGVMNGLAPNTEYTVSISNGYVPYKPANVVGTYTWLVEGTYSHDLVITTQNPDGTFPGYGGYPAGDSPYTASGQTSETITGQVVGNQVTFTTTYAGPYNPGYSATVSGTINTDGTMSGTSPWEWHTTSGTATPQSGSTVWPGLFDNLQPLTFTTDANGSGSWHINLTDANFPAEDPSGTQYTLSVWVAQGGTTVLISDNFTVDKG